MILFAYQTLNEPRVQVEVWGKSLEGTPDILPNYRRIIHTDGYHDVVSYSGGKGVHGIRYDITPEMYEKVIEWEKDRYDPHQVKLKSGKRAIAFMLKAEMKDKGIKRG